MLRLHSKWGDSTCRARASVDLPVNFPYTSGSPQGEVFRAGWTEGELAHRGAGNVQAGDLGVPIDKSLRRRGRLVRSRNVMTREERIDHMKREETWIAGRSPLGLPKTRVVKVATKKKK